MVVLQMLDHISFPTPSSNSKISRDVNVAGTHHAYGIEFLDGSAAEPRADIISQISNVRVLLDGVVKIDASGTFLMRLNESINGLTGPAGFLYVPLTPAEFPFFAAKAQMAYGTGDTRNIVVELDFATVSATSPNLKLHVLGETQTRDLGAHRTIKTTTHTFSSTGIQEITDLPTIGAQAGYKAIHVTDVGDNDITDVTVKRNQIEVHRNVRREQIASYYRASGNRAHIDEHFSIPFDLANTPQAFLPMIGTQDLRLELNWGVSPGGNYSIVSEIYEGLKLAN